MQLYQAATIVIGGKFAVL